MFHYNDTTITYKDAEIISELNHEFTFKGELPTACVGFVAIRNAFADFNSDWLLFQSRPTVRNHMKFFKAKAILRELCDKYETVLSKHEMLLAMKTAAVAYNDCE